MKKKERLRNKDLIKDAQEGNKERKDNDTHQKGNERRFLILWSQGKRESCNDRHRKRNERRFLILRSQRKRVSCRMEKGRLLLGQVRGVSGWEGLLGALQGKAGRCSRRVLAGVCVCVY